MAISRSTRSINNRISIIVILTVFFFLIFVGVWAANAKLEQVSRAPGQVIPTGRLQVLQSSDGGVITEILVHEGEHVKANQLLVRLDDSKINSAVGEARGKVASLMSSMARINAELFDKPLSFPPEVRAFPELMANQTELYHQRRQAVKDQIASLREMLALVEQELNLNMPLLKAGDVSKTDVLRLQRAVSDLRAQIVNVRNKYLSDLQTEFTKTQEDLLTAREVLNQRDEVFKGTAIRAPVDGIVKNVRLTTIGAVLRPGDEVLSIVPTGDKLIVEAKVAPSDIAYLKVGQGASIRFDAYDASIYGAGQGKVIFISPDTITETRPTGDTAYYRVHVSVDTALMKPHLPGEKIEVQPGMTASVEIQTGNNTVLKYLTKPITKTFSEAMTER